MIDPLSPMAPPPDDEIGQVRAALAALDGARGGTSIPEGDVASVRAHLEKRILIEGRRTIVL